MLKENKDALQDVRRHFELTAVQVAQLSNYVLLLESWALRTNLVSKNDRPRIVQRHITESLQITRFDLLPRPCSLLDLGTGSGFPGIPLAIFYPDVQVTLLDSKRMKTLFLRDVVEHLALKNVRVICARAEEWSPDVLYDVVTARAVARLNVLWTLSCSLLKQEGCLFALKGGDLQKELFELHQQYRVSTRVLPITHITPHDNAEKKLVIVSQ